MIRLSLLALYVSGFSLLAFRKWFWSLCALILLMAVIEHPDMPKTILGIQGLNPWNLLLLSVVAGWAINRPKEGLQWDLPRHLTVLLLIYLAVILVGFVRMMADRSYIEDSVLSLISEDLINTVKWVIPGLLLYDGCRTRPRFRLAMICVLGVYVLLGIQVIKWMPLSAAVSGDSLSARSLKILVNEVGYQRVNMAAMLAGATWAMFALRAFVDTNRQRIAVILTTAMLVLAQALTAGRAGYATSAVVCLVLCLAKWRKYLLVAPVAAVVVLMVAPGVVQRFTQGFTPETQAVPTHVQELGTNAALYTITAGRNIMWPSVIEKISERPWIGYGRLAMVRTGLASYLMTNLDEGFSHPHNAYLEWLFDNGIIGFVLVMPFFALVLWYAYRLFMDRRNPDFEAVGGSALAMVLALMVASVGSQSFYPREGWLGMWCLIFLMFRVRTQREQALVQENRALIARRPFTVAPVMPIPSAAAAAAATAEAAPINRFGVRLRMPAGAAQISETSLWPPLEPSTVRVIRSAAERLRSSPNAPPPRRLRDVS